MSDIQSPVLPCNSCGSELESEDDVRDGDFCIHCFHEDWEDDPSNRDDEEDEDFPSTMEDPDEAKLDRILKISENADT